MAQSLSPLAVRFRCSAGRRPGVTGSAPAAAAVAIALSVLLACSQVRAESCDSVCEDPTSVEACGSGAAVWALQQPDGTCRVGPRGNFESAEAAEAERRSLARLERQSCRRTGECALFEQLDGSKAVCTACDRAHRLALLLKDLSPTPASTPAASAGPGSLRCPPEKWRQTAPPDRVERCFDAFTELPEAYSAGAACRSGDCRDGQGSYVWPDGQRYAGAFRRGLRHGQGTFTWPDGRKYVGGWREGRPSGLGTRIYADGSFLVGYFDKGIYLGDSEQYGDRFAEAERRATPASESGPAPAPPTPEQSASCEEQCNEVAELELNRIIDEYECCYARHAFCVHKIEIEAENCASARCLDENAARRRECDLRYACDEVRDSKHADFRSRSVACLEGCRAQNLEEQGLKVSERGTLYTD